MNVTTSDLVIIGVIAGLALILWVGLWIAGRGR